MHTECYMVHLLTMKILNLFELGNVLSLLEGLSLAITPQAG